MDLAFKARTLSDIENTGENSTGIIARTKKRRHPIREDAFGDNIWYVAFETSADLDAHAAIFDRNQKQNTVVFFSLAEFPDIKGFDGRLFNRNSIQSVDDQKLKLRFALLIHLLGEIQNQPTVFGRQHAHLILHR